MEIDNIISWDTEFQALTEIKKIRNEVIGSDRLKERNMNIICKMVEYLWKKESIIELKIECAIVLASLSFGNDVIMEELINSNVHHALIHCLKGGNLKLVEASLRGLASILPNLNNDVPLFKDKNLAASILSYLNLSRNTNEYVISILIHLTNHSMVNDILFKEETICKIFPLLQCNITRVLMQALKLFIKISSLDSQAAKYISEAENDKGKLVNVLSDLQNKDQKADLQLASAHCVVILFQNNALKSTDHLVCQKTLDTLVSCCMGDKSWGVRVESAIILSELIERDLLLQRTAAISNQILKIMEEYLVFQDQQLEIYDGVKLEADDLKNAAFSVLAAISSNTEDFRKKIKDSEVICGALLKCLENGGEGSMLGVFRLILPLSRSVYILRTWFREKLIHQFVIEAFMSAEEADVIIVTSSIICNMIIDFSPFIQAIMEEKESVNEGEGMSEQKSAVILKILRLTRSTNSHIQLNAISCLMNATFSDDIALKKDLLSYLKHDDLFHIIRSSTPPDNHVINNALATVRNFLSPLQMVDYVASIHGSTIIESVILILEGDYPIDVKEQALCILVNLSAGSQSQKLIMENNDVLRKMISYLMHNSEELQLASNECIFNLVSKQNSGFSKRQEILRDMQCFKVLQELHSTSTNLFKERIKATLQEI